MAKDPFDTHTIHIKEIPMAEKLPTYRINYGYAVKGKLRSAALILNAKNLTEAKEAAVKQLNEEYDWHNITSIKQV